MNSGFFYRVSSLVHGVPVLLLAIQYCTVLYFQTLFILFFYSSKNKFALKINPNRPHAIDPQTVNVEPIWRKQEFGNLQVYNISVIDTLSLRRISSRLCVSKPRVYCSITLIVMDGVNRMLYSRATTSFTVIDASPIPQMHDVHCEIVKDYEGSNVKSYPVRRYLPKQQQ